MQMGRFGETFFKKEHPRDVSCNITMNYTTIAYFPILARVNIWEKIKVILPYSNSDIMLSNNRL